MSHELSFLIYGGQLPRRILHCSRDVVEEERQSMLTWCTRLKAMEGEYDKFISSGGMSWIDVPTSTDRRLFLRVFATKGEARDCWYFFGLFLSDHDYQTIWNYGKIVSYVEGFSIDDLIKTRPAGSKLEAEFGLVDQSQYSMPPLFNHTKSSEWTNAVWVQERAKRSQHVDGKRIHIAFNPPQVECEYTSLLLSVDFPKPGLRLKSKPTVDIQDSPVQKKKKVMKGSTLALSILVILAFTVGYLIGSSKPGTQLSLKTDFLIGGQIPITPTIRLPRRPSTSIDVSVKGNKDLSNDILVRASVDWITVGAAVRRSAREFVFPLRVIVPEGSAINETLHASADVTQGSEVIGSYRFEIEPAGVGVSLQPKASQNNTTSNGKNLFSGIATARYGLKTVEVEGLPVELNLSAKGTLGIWNAELNSGLETVSIVVVDSNGNQFASTENVHSLPH